MSVTQTPADILALAGQAHELHQKGEMDKAEQLYTQILGISPDEPYILRDYGTLLGQRGRHAEAVAFLSRSASLEPGDAMTHQQLGIAFGFIGRFDEQRYHYDRSLDIAPNTPQAMWNLSLHQLVMRDYENGWENYQWGIISGGRAKRTLKPEWDGRELAAGTVLLVWAEQGFGDTIHFSRFFDRLRDHVGPDVKIVFEVQRELFCLYGGLPHVDQVVIQQFGGPIPYSKFEHCSLMSLPRVLKIYDESTFWSGEYCHVESGDAAGVGSIHDLNGMRVVKDLTKRPARVGLVWSGNPRHPHDHARSIPAEEFAKLTDGILDTEFFSLNPAVKESPSPRIQIAPVKSFADTAAFLATLDLVISVDTSTVHLAGAMGRPVWLLLPNCPDWRWSLGRETSPWYPSVRLFRQPHPGGSWEAPLARVRRELVHTFGLEAQAFTNGSGVETNTTPWFMPPLPPTLPIDEMGTRLFPGAGMCSGLGQFSGLSERGGLASGKSIFGGPSLDSMEGVEREPSWGQLLVEEAPEPATDVGSYVRERDRLRNNSKPVTIKAPRRARAGKAVAAHA